MKTSSAITSFLSLLSLTNAQWPVDAGQAIIREIEHIILDKSNTNLKAMISPCSQYIDSSVGTANPNLGRQTAAEWIRTAFHDFVTGNTYTYTGGLDASIGYELNREENIGTAFNDALTNFGYYFNARVSMADLIAIGAVLSAGHCGGTPVVLRGGRVDATAAGPTGVPMPQEPINVQLGKFSNVQFNKGDVIALTTCGHTMGGVRKKDFPTINNAYGTVEGTDQRIAFDSSSSTFDTNVAKEYLTGTGNKGGALVTTSNATMRSDFRLYTSDNNDTVTRMAQSQSYFTGQCSGLFQRMIEVVPGSVRLTTPVNPTTTTNLKPYNVDLNLKWDGTMTLTGYLRYVQVSGSGAGPTTYKVTLIGRNGQTQTQTATATRSSADTGTGLFGATWNYKFTLTFPAATGVGGIQVGTTKFTFQDAMFVVPGLSSFSPAPPAFSSTPALNTQASYTANITVAVRISPSFLQSGVVLTWTTNADLISLQYFAATPPASLSATLQYPVTQTGTVSPAIDSSTKVTLKQIGKVGGYGIYSGKLTKTLSGKQIYGMSVDASASGQAPGSGGIGFYKFARY